jgi:ADP-heptose:LPS heptosyltransferase
MKRFGERGNGVLRRVDRVVGIPLVLAIAAFRHLAGRIGRPIPRDPRVIGLLKVSGIGDAVILSGVITDLRAHFPNARLVLFSGKNNHAFARLLDDVDEVIPLPVLRPDRALRLVRAERPDIVIDFGIWSRLDAILATLSGAQWVAGIGTRGHHRHYAYDVVVPHTREHEVKNYRNLVAPLGVHSTRAPGLRACTGSTRPLERSYAVLHLWPGGANSQERSWPADRWARVARALRERGQAVVLTGGPADAERTRALVDVWKEDSLDVHSVAGVPAEETIVWLRHAHGTISVNTGLLHLAAAVGTPVVALNGPTSGRRWGPLGEHTRCVSSPMIPEGYLNLGWERNNRYCDCMLAITPEVVMAAWDELLAEVSASSGPFMHPQIGLRQSA